MKNCKLFITPYSASDEGGDMTGDAAALESLLNQMDSGAESGTDDQAGNSSGQQEQTQDNSQENSQQSQQSRSDEDKRNFAFGQMRTQITQLTDLLGKVARANGVEYNDSKDLVAKLTDDTIQKMAQKQNVPVELLREVEALRQDSAAFKAQQLKDAAAIGFQNVMNTYGLTQEQLTQFAVELDQKGKNPFTQPVDLMNEYKMMHYDDILNAAVKKAVEEALKKDSAANQSSTTPEQQQGGNGGSDQKITTVAGLTALLDGLK